jgi:hypothetical protein
MEQLAERTEWAYAALTRNELADPCWKTFR